MVFVRSFGEPPGWVKITHAVALAAIALSVVLLMTPAALHRIAYDGENSPSFFRISSALVVAAAFPLAVGIAADICVSRVQHNRWRAACFAEWLRIFADPRNVLVLPSALAPPCQRSAFNYGRAQSTNRSQHRSSLHRHAAPVLGRRALAYGLDAARDAQVEQLVERAPERTIFTRFLPPENPEDAPGRWRAYYKKWSQVTRRQIDNRLIDLLAVLTRYAPPATIFGKAVYSAFGNPQLHQHLRERQIDTLIVSGSETDVCVLSSILAAVDYGYGSS